MPDIRKQWSRIVVDRAGCPRMHENRVMTGMKVWVNMPDAREPIYLTPAQQEVLRLIAENRVTKEIASDMGISPKTVEYHRCMVYQKLGCVGTAAITKVAVLLGLTKLDPPSPRK